jgi:hypothetical protein
MKKRELKYRSFQTKQFQLDPILLKIIWLAVTGDCIVPVGASFVATEPKVRASQFFNSATLIFKQILITLY